MIKFKDWIIKKNYKKWEPTRLLENIPEERKSTVALALEGQRLRNELNLNTTDELARFKRISIPMIRRLLGALPKAEGSMEELPKYHTFKTTLDFPETVDSNGYYSLDKEAEYVADILKNLVSETEELAGDKHLTICSIYADGNKILMNYSLE
jgi:hypothetical protein